MIHNNKSKIIVAISGASGATYAIQCLKILRTLKIETHLVISKNGYITIKQETNYLADEVHNLAQYTYHWADLSARISSGSFQTNGMIILPCSMRTLSAISSSLDDNLITRAASVTLKEKRRLILVTRETPLHHGHIENMLKVSSYGAVIAPPVPAFYNKPQSLEEMVSYSVVRMLDLFDLNLHNINLEDIGNAQTQDQDIIKIICNTNTKRWGVKE